MLASRRHLGFPEQPQAGSLAPSDRKEKKNHTSKLHELALMIPVSQKTRNKKLTKKEILLHILHYIQYLQRSIDVAKALLRLHISEGKDGLGGLGLDPSVGPAKRRQSTPSSSPSSQKSHLWGRCQKPKKKKFTRVSERPGWPQKPRRSLSLDQPEKLVTFPGQEEGSGGATTPLRCPQLFYQPKVSSSLSGGDGGEGTQLMLLDMAGNTVTCDITSECDVAGTRDDETNVDMEAQKRVERSFFLSKAQSYLRQDLFLIESSKDVDKEAPDTDPWLPAWTSKDSLNGSPLALVPPQINTWCVTGHSSKVLALSPSHFSSPSETLPDHILEDDTYFLTEGLFEEVVLMPPSPSALCEPEVPQEKSSGSLDYCYLLKSKDSKVPPSSSSESSDTESLWGQEEDKLASPNGLQSSSEEDEDYKDEDYKDEDYTWTPTLSIAGRKSKKGPTKSKDSKKASCPGQVKKKCVNGFIMFCRMNRKQYIRACPGTASTAATKELAQLWREMTPEERRPYCTKARRFSRQHNRIVKQDCSSSDEDWEIPKPFYQLLAEKAKASLSTESLPIPQSQ